LLKNIPVLAKGWSSELLKLKVVVGNWHLWGSS